MVREELQVLAALYKEAEEALYVAEVEHGNLSMPSINQLRYAGHHLLSALTGEEVDSKEAMKKAEHHCQRAIYDASDSVIVYFLENIRLFKKDFKNVEILPNFPAYADIREKAREGMDFITKARADGESRHQYYKGCREIVVILRQCNNRMEDAREDLNKAIRLKNQDVYRTWLTITISVISVIIAAIAAVLVI